MGKAAELKTKYRAVIAQNQIMFGVKGINNPNPHAIMCKTKRTKAECLFSYPPKKHDTNELAKTPPNGPLTAIMKYDTNTLYVSLIKKTVRI